MSGILITLLVRPGQKKSSELLFTEEPGYTSDHNTWLLLELATINQKCWKKCLKLTVSAI